MCIVSCAGTQTHRHHPPIDVPNSVELYLHRDHALTDRIGRSHKSSPKSTTLPPASPSLSVLHFKPRICCSLLIRLFARHEPSLPSTSCRLSMLASSRRKQTMRSSCVHFRLSAGVSHASFSNEDSSCKYRAPCSGITSIHHVILKTQTGGALTNAFEMWINPSLVRTAVTLEKRCKGQ